MILMYKKKLLFTSISLILSKFMLKSPAMINSLLLFVKDATTEENSVVKACICSFSILGGLYMNELMWSIRTYYKV